MRTIQPIGPIVARGRADVHGLLPTGVVAVLLGTRLAFGQAGTDDADPAPPVAGVVEAEVQEAAIESTPTSQDGPSYPIGSFELRYLREVPDHPPIEDLMQIEVELGPTAQGFVVPRSGEATMVMRLADIEAREVEVYYASAVQRVLEAVRDDLTARGLIGLYVTPDPLQIDELGEDLRAPDQTRLTLIITTGIVTELRTLASGERIPSRERVNNPLHERIRTRSPIQPFSEEDPERSSLLRKEALDRYVLHLSRHPGRRVDVALSAGLEPGTTALDYFVTENDPLTLYAQVSNTGTNDTSDWRERFGLIHSQLTNNDDILTIDYSTADFDEYHAIVGSYEAPFPNDRIRWRVEAGYSDYTASDVGAAFENFRGHTWFVTGELIGNIYQDRELFIDLFGGARFEHIDTNNQTFAIDADEDFFSPYIGLRLERSKIWFSTYASVALEVQDGDVTDVDEPGLDALGRTNPDSDWAIMKWNLRHSVYLEPLLNRESWEDPTTPSSSTLAHELELRFFGQWAFDNRLIAQKQQTAGGLYTVRGYDESLTAGDTVLVGGIQYNYHLPRTFRIEPEPREFLNRTFRYAPQYVYGRPDWDLILRGFVDAAWVNVNDALSFEDDETLVGAGFGVEMRYRRNVRVVVDWGFALHDVRDNDAGDNRIHIIATLIF